ncbi:MAG: DNA repair ATPase, partial [Bradymonadaceae bacterium]
MTTDPQAQTTDASASGEDQQAAEEADSSSDVRGSNYEVIRDRLADQAAELREQADTLNEKRQEVFGGTEMTVAGQVTIRTEHNCIPQDIVNIGGRLLFGYNVYIGMKTSTSVDDVFSLHHFDKSGDGFSVEPMPEDSSKNFLSQQEFVNHFDDLYTYYDDVRLRKLLKLETRLLAVFQTGTTRDDIRVLRWGLDADERAEYIDNTGERDLPEPDQQDFDWQPVLHEDHITGKHPHVSILDEVFVETVGGDLTVKIEDNTEDGKGIYSEPVEDPHQSLGDAEIEYVEIGNLILIKVLPYREDDWRYLVFNTLTDEVRRIDAIGQACITLPEQHGIIFPGGYVLSEGNMREFDIETEGMRFQERIRSANGEDVMYVFYRPQDGSYLLLSYNVISKDVEHPISCHGYSTFRDGTMAVFEFTGEEATRVHPMQIWQTPYHSDEYVAEQPTDDSLLANLGNAELVRGISDLLGLCRMIDDVEPSVAVYEALIKAAQQLLDNYFWLAEEEVGEIASLVEEVVSTAELVVEEFRKVQSLKQKAADRLAEAEDRQDELLLDTRYDEWSDLEKFVDELSQLREQRGHLITLKDVRYIDKERLEELEQEVSDQYETVTEATVDFLLSEDALAPYREKLSTLTEQVETFETANDGEALVEDLDATNEQLTLLTDVVSGLQIEDPNKRTEILEAIGEILSEINQIRSKLDNRLTEVREQEGKAEFSVQFQLLDQTINSALGMADTPEACDEQLSRVLTQLEDLESRFSEFDNFLEKLADKRSEIYDTFESRKQSLLEERQRKARHIADSAERVLETVLRRAGDKETIDELNAFFASDQMVMKVRDHIEQLRELGEDVKADDLQTQLTSAKDQAIRKLRDKIDLFEGGDNVIKLGRHSFSVNTQDVELTMVPRDGQMMLHITGSDFFQPVDDEEFQQTREFWDQPLVSETDAVYRAEYLAATILFEAEDSEDPPNVSDLHEKNLEEDGLLELVGDAITDRFDEGYERGVHDEDAAAILGAVVDMYVTAGLLRYTPEARAIATLFWAFADDEQKEAHARRAGSLGRLRSTFEHARPLRELGDELGDAIAEFAGARDLTLKPEATDEGHVGRFTESRCREAGRYLAEELVDERPAFVVGDDAAGLRDDFISRLERDGTRLDFQNDLETIEEIGAAYDLVEAWLSGYVDREADDELAPVVPEAAALLLTDGELDHDHTSTSTRTQVEDLLGQHSRIDRGTLEIRLDEFLTRLRHYVEEHVPAWREYKKMSRELAEKKRRELAVDELEPQVLSTFVRNALIDEVYLPMVGDNLAKQMGTA